MDVAYSGSSQADYKSRDSTTTDGQPYQYNPLFDIWSYTIVNVRLGMASADNNWRTFVYARNLSNEFYFTNVIQGSDMRVRYVGKPVTYGVTFQYNW